MTPVSASLFLITVAQEDIGLLQVFLWQLTAQLPLELLDGAAALHVPALEAE